MFQAEQMAIELSRTTFVLTLYISKHGNMESIAYVRVINRQQLKLK